MRLFLDAHVSAKRVAPPLREQGHDVRAADEERSLDGEPDEALLELAAAEGRIMVTFDVADFPELVRRWAEAGKEHTGCAIVVGIDHGEIGAILRALDHALSLRPDQDEWRNYTAFVPRVQ